MEQLFISAGGKMRARWRDAFPDARAVRLVENQLAAARKSDLLWLEYAATPTAEQQLYLQNATNIGARVIIMAPTPTEAQAFQLLTAGAVGYCHVEAAPEQLKEIALVITQGGLWMPPGLVQRLLALSLRLTSSRVTPTANLEQLTSRELAVAREVARGASNREIAGILAISERTVKAHLSVVFEKLGVRDRVQLALAMNNIPAFTGLYEAPYP